MSTIIIPDHQDVYDHLNIYIAPFLKCPDKYICRQHLSNYFKPVDMLSYVMFCYIMLHYVMLKYIMFYHCICIVLYCIILEMAI